jgi:curved DNA-binding protein CbpA
LFVDYYELLEMSPNANSETVERIFRYFAMRYHPDNQQTGNEARFSEIVEAHNVLKDPVKRAQYDIAYQEHSGMRLKLAGEASDAKGVERDAVVQAKLLSLLYVKRRQDVTDPGIGDVELERLSGCPREHLEFHIWYMKAKGWISRIENGTIAITVEGVDRANSEHLRDPAIRLLDHAATSWSSADRARSDRQGLRIHPVSGESGQKLLTPFATDGMPAPT